MHFESGTGHIGGNLSVLDLLLYLHHRLMGPEDVFVLSKGHAAGAWYVTSWTMGRLSERQLRGFHADATGLSGHPTPGFLEGLATGSLGHGLPLAAGVALARKLEGRKGHVYCVTSDGEWQEGSNWEAIAFARHHRLENLVVLVDDNRLQGFGRTDEVSSIGPLCTRLEAFGAVVAQGDGHCWESMETCLRAPAAHGPSVVVFATVKGKGVSFMEDRLEWHYLPMSPEQYERALEEVNDS